MSRIGFVPTSYVRRFASHILALVVFAGLPAPTLAQDKPAADAPPQMTEEQMKQMMAMIQPGPMHAELAKSAGAWKTSAKMWEGGGDPVTGDGTARFEVVLGGRYVLGRHTGNYRGMPFEGLSIDGYDNTKKQYISFWFDNFGTGVMQLTGQPAAGGKGVDLAGTMFDPATGVEMKVREELRYEGDTRFSMTMFMQPPGGAPEMKVMEYTGVRQ